MDIDHLFTYHAPTDEQKPKYAAIRAAEGSCSEVLVALVTESDTRLNVSSHDAYKEVNAVTKEFFKVVLEVCPTSADTSAALRCIRLARNAMNEYVTNRYEEIAGIARAQILQARWQACSAIALQQPEAPMSTGEDCGPRLRELVERVRSFLAECQSQRPSAGRSGDP